jgi:hypothetical protein
MSCALDSAISAAPLSSPSPLLRCAMQVAPKVRPVSSQIMIAAVAYCLPLQSS